MRGAGVANTRSTLCHSAISAAVTGNFCRCWAARASSSSSKHRSGVLPLTPRGSNPTRSYASCTSCGYPLPVLRTEPTPDPPGPPGLMNSKPLRFGRVGGRQPQRRDGDRPAGGAVVVQRDRHIGALEPVAATALSDPRRISLAHGPGRRCELNQGHRQSRQRPRKGPPWPRSCESVSLELLQVLHAVRGCASTSATARRRDT